MLNISMEIIFLSFDKMKDITLLTILTLTILLMYNQKQLSYDYV